jgi:hypothetical protein
MECINSGDLSFTTSNYLESAANSLLKRHNNSIPRITHEKSSPLDMMKEDLASTTLLRNVTTSYPPSHQYSFFGWWLNRLRKKYPARSDEVFPNRKARKVNRPWTGASMALIVVVSCISTLYSIITVRDFALGGGSHKSPAVRRIQYLTDSRNLARRYSGSYAQQRNLSSPIESNSSSRPSNDPHRTFPKWGTTIEEENTVGLSLDPIFDFLFTSSAFISPIASPTNKHVDTNSSAVPSYRPILDWAWTETLYMVEPGGTLLTSKKHRAVQNIDEKPKVHRRFHNTERLMLKALDILKREYPPQKSCVSSQWPTLCKTIFPASSNGGQGFPFLSWYGDFDGCNYHNWVSSSRELVSVPLFTVAARLDCNYTIPFPNYYSHMMSAAPEWDRLFARYGQRYPWALKTPRVAWRGGRPLYSVRRYL